MPRLSCVVSNGTAKRKSTVEVVVSIVFRSRSTRVRPAPQNVGAPLRPCLAIATYVIRHTSDGRRYARATLSAAVVVGAAFPWRDVVMVMAVTAVTAVSGVIPADTRAGFFLSVAVRLVA